jgi:hypothetical protein
MRMLFLILGALAGLGGVVAIQFKHKIKSLAVRTILLAGAAIALFAMAGDETYRLTDGFTTWSALASINVFVPLGWFMGGSFVLLLTIMNFINKRESETCRANQ